MTKRAIAIKGLVNELIMLSIDGTAIKMGMKGMNPTLTTIEAQSLLLQHQYNMQAYMVDILENNSEQAEALFAELNIKWTNPPTE